MYDGTGWSYFGMDQGLTARYITDMEEGPEGKIWIATYDRGIGYYDKGEWQSYTPDCGWEGGFIETLDVAPDGTVRYGLPRDQAYPASGRNDRWGRPGPGLSCKRIIQNRPYILPENGENRGKIKSEVPFCSLYLISEDSPAVYCLCLPMKLKGIIYP